MTKRVGKVIYSKWMAFKCACCGEHVSFHVLLQPTLERICRTCYDAMKQLNGLTIISDEGARIRKVTKEQVLFFGITWVEVENLSPQTEGEQRLLDEQAIQDCADLFG